MVTSELRPVIRIGQLCFEINCRDGLAETIDEDVRHFPVYPSLSEIVQAPRRLVDVRRKRLVQIVRRAGIVNHEVARERRTQIGSVGRRDRVIEGAADVRFVDVALRQITSQRGLVNIDRLADQLLKRRGQFFERRVEMPAHQHRTQQTSGLFLRRARVAQR